MATRTFRTVFALEWTLLRGNRAIWGILALVLALAVVAALNGQARVAASRAVVAGLNDDERQTEAALKSTVARWEANPQADPPTVTSPGTVGFSLLSHYAALPAAPLAALAAGQSDILPSYVRVTANPAYTFLTMNEITNPLNALTGGFDVAFVIVFLLPIVIIALTFDLVSREKEMGVIALIAAAGVSLPRTIFAKAAARGVLILSTLVIMSAAVMILGVDGPIPLGSWLRWLAVVSLYGGFWFALALAVNSRNRPSVTNGVILANIWLVLVVVVPAFVNTVTNALYPAPSRVELTTAMREATEEVDKAAAGAREAFFFDHPDMAGKAGNADAYFVQVIATNAAIEKAVAPLLATFDHQAAKRERTVDLLQYLSPALVAQQALTVLSATDSLRFADFTEQVLAFHRTWRDFFESRVLHGERMTAASFDQIPKFEYAARPMNAAGFLSALLSLAAVTGVLAIWSARRLNRYPVV